MPRRLFRRKRRPSGVGGPPDARGFAIRHRFVLVILLAQVPALAAVGLARGVPPNEIVVASLLLIALGVLGILARSPAFAAAWIAMGLVTAAGILVRYFDGSTGSTFAFFLAIVAISFYRDRRALILGFVYVAAYHLFAAVVLYRDTLTQTQDETTPVIWPVLHLSLTLVLVLLLMAGWRVTVRVETRSTSRDDGFRLSFDKAPVGMAVLTPSGEFVHANPALTDLLGHDPGHLAGANIRGVIHGYDLDKLGEAWEEMANHSNETITSWMRCRTSDGREIWGRLSLAFRPGTKNREAMILLQLEDADEEYHQQQRLESLVRDRDHYVATIAEEIRDPIGSVLDLTDQGEDPELCRIEGHVQQIASILEDLIVSARGDTASASVVAGTLDAGELCAATLSGIPGAENIAVQIGARKLWADPGLTQRILYTLVTNAIRYGGSRVVVKTAGSGPDTLIQVVDDGPEVPPSERERIFNGDLHSGQPVTRPASVGLSLTVARHLARQMDGDIEYRRTSDGRNIFELRLPSEQMTAGAEPASEPVRVSA